MSKKTTTHLVPSVNKKPHELSKLQKQFNTKTNKIKTLKEDIELVEQAIPILKQRIHEELVPIRTEIAKTQTEIIVLLDAAYYHKSITKTEKQKIKSFITDHAFVLIDRYKHEHLIAIFNRYSEDTYEEIQAEVALEGKKMMAGMFKQMGINVDLDDINFQDIDEAMQQVTEKFAENIGEAKERIAQQAEEDELRKANRKKNSQQIMQDKIQEQQKEAMNKTLKELYTQLVKEFHPDKELDLEKKAWKTEIMKEITAAYESKDFFALLKLQLQFEQRDANSFEDLSDEKLKHFIKILDEQIEDFKMELEMLQNPPMMPRDLEDIGEFLHQPKKIEQNFKVRKGELNMLLEDAKQQAYEFVDIKAVKQFIKFYQDESDMDFDIEELLQLMTRGK
jgi:histone H3/H4